MSRNRQAKKKTIKTQPVPLTLHEIVDGGGASAGNTSEETCILCADSLKHVAIGPCGHSQVCTLCVLRLRALYQDKNCCICKTPCSKVVLTSKIHASFDDFSLQKLMYDRVWDVYVDDPEYFNKLKQLRQFMSPFDRTKLFKNMHQLKKHLKQEYQLMYCDLCLKDRKVFLPEQKLYTREQLEKHNQGESGEEAFKGHPKCNFCAHGFYDEDHLYQHLHEKHHECTVCARTGKPHQYFKNAHTLYQHFHDDHFLCLEPECTVMEELRYSVFASAIDLKAHMIEKHMSGGRAEKKKARQIETNFVVRGSRGDPSRGTSGREYREEGGSSSHAHNDVEESGGSDNLTNEVIMAMGNLQPVDSKDVLDARNRSLIQRIKTIFSGNEEKFRYFRTVSGQFRKGTLTPQQYYTSFRKVFGDHPDKDAVFQEMCALLPDKVRMKELLEYHIHYSAQEAAFPSLGSQGGASAPTPYQPIASPVREEFPALRPEGKGKKKKKKKNKGRSSANQGVWQNTPSIVQQNVISPAIQVMPMASNAAVHAHLQQQQRARQQERSQMASNSASSSSYMLSTLPPSASTAASTSAASSSTAASSSSSLQWSSASTSNRVPSSAPVIPPGLPPPGLHINDIEEDRLAWNRIAQANGQHGGGYAGNEARDVPKGKKKNQKKKKVLLHFG